MYNSADKVTIIVCFDFVTVPIRLPLFVGACFHSASLQRDDYRLDASVTDDGACAVEFLCFVEQKRFIPH